jgi:hypothetical protein
MNMMNTTRNPGGNDGLPGKDLSYCDPYQGGTTEATPVALIGCHDTTGSVFTAVTGSKGIFTAMTAFQVTAMEYLRRVNGLKNSRCIGSVSLVMDKIVHLVFRMSPF